MNTARIAPWPDSAGNTIHEGDTIITAQGERGTVEYQQHRDDEELRWRVRYVPARAPALLGQISEPIRAVVETSTENPA